MNKVILVGRLTKDPEIHYASSNIPKATFHLAVDRRYAKKNGTKQTADFIPVAAWRKLAEIVGNNLCKGRRILVDGSLSVRSFDGEDGSRRYYTEVVADTIEFLDTKKQGTPSNTNAPATPNPPMNPSPMDYPVNGAEPIPDEEIPF